MRTILGSIRTYHIVVRRLVCKPLSTNPNASKLAVLISLSTKPAQGNYGRFREQAAHSTTWSVSTFISVSSCH